MICKNILTEVLNSLVNATRIYGGVVKLWVKPFAPMVLVSDRVVVGKILKSDEHLQKSHSYKVLLELLGENLGTMASG